MCQMQCRALGMRWWKTRVIILALMETCNKCENIFIPPWPVWLSWLGHLPVYQKVMGLIPSQVTYTLGCRFHPRVRTNWCSLSHPCLSLSLFFSPSFFPLSLFPSLKKTNKPIFGWGFKIYFIFISTRHLTLQPPNIK